MHIKNLKSFQIPMQFQTEVLYIYCYSFLRIEWNFSSKFLGVDEEYPEKDQR